MSQCCKGTSNCTHFDQVNVNCQHWEQIKTLNNIKDVLIHLGMLWKTPLTNIPSQKDRGQYGNQKVHVHKQLIWIKILKMTFNFYKYQQMLFL